MKDSMSNVGYVSRQKVHSSRMCTNMKTSLSSSSISQGVAPHNYLFIQVIVFTSQSSHEKHHGPHLTSAQFYGNILEINGSSQ
jgi:hypothetical protein